MRYLQLHLETNTAFIQHYDLNFLPHCPFLFTIMFVVFVLPHHPGPENKGNLKKDHIPIKKGKSCKNNKSMDKISVFLFLYSSNKCVCLCFIVAEKYLVVWSWSEWSCRKIQIHRQDIVFCFKLPLVLLSPWLQNSPSIVSSSLHWHTMFLHQTSSLWLFLVSKSAAGCSATKLLVVCGMVKFSRSLKLSSISSDSFGISH